MKFRKPLDEVLDALKGRRYICLSEVEPDVTRRNGLGQKLHQEGYKRFQLKYRTRPVWVWCLDRAVEAPIAAEARAELERHGVTWVLPGPCYLGKSS